MSWESTTLTTACKVRSTVSCTYSFIDVEETKWRKGKDKRERGVRERESERESQRERER